MTEKKKLTKEEKIEKAKKLIADLDGLQLTEGEKKTVLGCWLRPIDSGDEGPGCREDGEGGDSLR